MGTLHHPWRLEGKFACVASLLLVMLEPPDYYSISHCGHNFV